MNKRNKSELIVILDNIRSALNVGAVFRTCDAAGVDKLFLCGITAYPPHNKIPKTALGATESVQWEYFGTTIEAIKKLRKEKGSIEILSAEVTGQAVSMWEYDFKPQTALIFGNEVTGVSEEVLEASDAHVKIPMFGEKKSLNVATSVGIIVYHSVKTLSTKLCQSTFNPQ